MIKIIAAIWIGVLTVLLIAKTCQLKDTRKLITVQEQRMKVLNETISIQADRIKALQSLIELPGMELTVGTNKFSHFEINEN